MNERKAYSYEVAFKGNRREIYSSPQDIKRGVRVIVNVEKGIDSGTVSTSKQISETAAQNLPKIQRVAAKEDLERIARNVEKEKNAYRLCKQKIAEYNLDMKLIGAELQFDGGKLTFFFTSPQRVDFRELVKALAGIYHTRIDLRQVGSRDEARIVSGVGPCGRALCCSSCVKTCKEVSSQYAKDQQLSMNPLKITGNCDRYLCCLAYEQESYIDAYTRIPRAGSLFTPENRSQKGEVIFVDIFKERIQVKFVVKNKDEKPTTQYEWFDLQQINVGKVEENKIIHAKGKENAAQ